MERYDLIYLFFLRSLGGPVIISCTWARRYYVTPLAGSHCFWRWVWGGGGQSELTLSIFVASTRGARHNILHLGPSLLRYATGCHPLFWEVCVGGWGAV